MENKALVNLWANAEKRRAFLEDYKAWGVWITTPELGLTYYKYNLPDGTRIIALEYQQENTYRRPNEEAYRTMKHYYLWEGERFIPHFSSESEILEKLKKIKVRIQKKLRKETEA